MELDYITDAQLFWHDFLRPIANAFELHRENRNADEGTVTRQIYTNTFYRKPLILRRLENFDKNIIQFNEPCMAYDEEMHSLWNSISESLSEATKIGIDLYTTNM